MDLLTHEGLPARIADVETLEELLSRPTRELVDDLARLEGDIMVLGVAGKVGPCLARMAKQAAPEKRVIGVARFSDPALRERLDGWGIETIACDLLDREAVAALPKVPNIISMLSRVFNSMPFGWA